VSSSRILLEEVLRVFVKVIEAGVGVEGVSEFGHVEGVPDITEEGITGDADGVIVCDLDSILSPIADGTDFVDAVDGLLGLADCACDLFDPVDMEEVCF
jgi:hypothetical protein